MHSAHVALAVCKRPFTAPQAPQLDIPCLRTALPDQVARGWVVAAVNDNVVLPHNVQGVEGVEALGVHLHLDARVEGLTRSLG